MNLKAKTREVVGKQVSALRAEKLIPASVYGPSYPSKNITVGNKELRALYKAVGYSSLFDLEIEGEKPIKALFKELQVEPVKSEVYHASFYAVDMSKPITTVIPFRFDGLSMAVKNNLGLVFTAMNDVMVSCLPGDLPNEIVINIGNLDNVGDAIFLKDLKLPKGVTFSGHSTNELVASIVSPQKSIEEETPAVEAEAGAADAAAALPGEGEAAAEEEEGKK